MDKENDFLPASESAVDIRVPRTKESGDIIRSNNPIAKNTEWQKHSGVMVSMYDYEPTVTPETIRQANIIEKDTERTLYTGALSAPGVIGEPGSFWKNVGKGMLDTAQDLPVIGKLFGERGEYKAQQALGATIIDATADGEGQEYGRKIAAQASKQLRLMRERDGITDEEADGWGNALGAGIVTMAEFVVASAITGGSQIIPSVLAGFQGYKEGASRDVEKYIEETGDVNLENYQGSAGNLVTNVASGVAQGAIEGLIGQGGRILNTGKIATGNAYTTFLARWAAESGANALEEKLQTLTGETAELIKGNSDLKEWFVNSLTEWKDAGVGAILGGTMSLTSYNGSHIKGVNKLKNKIQELYPEIQPATAERAAEELMTAGETSVVQGASSNVDAVIAIADPNSELTSIVKKAVLDTINAKIESSDGFADGDMSEEERIRFADTFTRIVVSDALRESVEQGIPLTESPLMKAVGGTEGLFFSGRDYSALNDYLAEKIDNAIHERWQKKGVELAEDYAKFREKETYYEIKTGDDKGTVYSISKTRAGKNKGKWIVNVRDNYGRYGLLDTNNILTEGGESGLHIARAFDSLEEAKTELAKLGSEQNLLFQDLENQIVDLSDDFNAFAKDSKKTISQYIKSLIGQVLETSSKPLQIAITKDNTPYIIKPRAMGKTSSKRHFSALSNIENIIKNAIYSGESDVDLTHNTNKKTLEHKQKVEKYIYFTSPIKINDVVYSVSLSAELVKGQDPNVLDLYDVNVKKEPDTNIISKSDSSGSLKRILNQEQVDVKWFDIADENARLDDIYPEYKGDTITVNGVERTVYNSNGDRIAKSAEALTNFWNWFGDSKVVDDNGRPLVVYHGTKDIFDTFETKRDNRYDSGQLGTGFYFTDSKESAEDYADWKRGNGDKIVMPLYVKSEKPLVLEKDTERLGTFGRRISKQLGIKIPESANLIGQSESDAITEKATSLGYDGVIAETNFGETYYVAFEPNQIKSTDNRGTFSKDTGNIYHQGNIGTGLRGKDARAAYDPVLDRLILGDNWDATSMLHELAHRQAQRIYHAVHSGQASPELEKRWLAIEDWLGVPENYWKSHDFLGRQYQEQFARAYEKFIYDGKFETSELKTLFKDLNKQFREIYEDLEYKYFDLKKQLSPELLELFNRIESIEKSETIAESTPEKLVEKGIITESEATELSSEIEASKAIESLLPTTKTETNDITKFNTGKTVQSETATKFEEEHGITTDKERGRRELFEKVKPAALEFVRNNEALAMDIVSGKATERDGLFRQDLYKALETYYTENDDIDGLLSLAPYTKIIGQEASARLGALRNIDGTNFLETLDAINDKIEKKNSKQIEKETSRLESELETVAFDWDESIDEQFMKEQECK